MVRLAVVYADFELKYFWYADFHPKKMPKMMCMLTSATPLPDPPLLLQKCWELKINYLLIPPSFIGYNWLDTYRKHAGP